MKARRPTEPRAARLARLEAQIAKRGEEVDWIGEAAGMPQLARFWYGVERAQEQIARARRELDRGNGFGCDYHIAAAEDALTLPLLSGPPRRDSAGVLRGAVTSLVEGARRTRANSSKAGLSSATKRRKKAAGWRKTIRAQVKRYISAGKSDTNIGLLLAAKTGQSDRTVAGFAAEVRKDLKENGEKNSLQ